jgi:GTP diphosphokinase / guanosine-3',5'-bis(diphosphate) 3'-diphosphatase
LRDIVDNAQRPEEFLEHTKLELFQDQVFCFTPKGDLIALPHGATPIDFAYAVHSAIGNTCVGSKVNGRLVSLRTVLRNGDQIEIHTSKASTPKEEWERIVATGKARAHIRRFFRNKHRTEFYALGRRMLDSLFKAEGYEVTDKVLETVCKQFNVSEAEDVTVAVGQGSLSAKDVFRACFPMHRASTDTAPLDDEQRIITLPTRTRAKVLNEKGQPIPIKGLIDGMAVKFARCCHPIPGDRIVGIINTGTGVTIHTIDCDTLENFADTPERWLDLTWDSDGQVPFVSRVHLFVLNNPGSLGALSTTIGKNGGNITNLKFTNRTSDYFEMDVDVEVTDVKHLNSIIGALRATSGVQTVERTKTN